MVNGIRILSERLGKYSDQFTIIGGTACSILFHEVDLDFRSTYDFDIVLIIEMLNASFIEEFWDFIHEGGYTVQEKNAGKPQFYRFSKPSNEIFTKMIELFSRIPDGVCIKEDSRLVPIHVSDEISSLSAILLDDAYYNLLRSGRVIIGNLPVLKAEYLVPFKMKAWLDLTERRNNGQIVDAKDIKKHRNDVFRIVPLLNTVDTVEVSPTIKADIDSFLHTMRNETLNLKSLGIPNRSLNSIIELYTKLYVCTEIL